MNPGTSTTIHIALSGLSKGDWTDTDIFFRGNGDIIGATKIDEKILEEIRKTEALSAVRKEIHDVNNMVPDIDKEKTIQVITESNEDPEKIDIFSKFEEDEV